MNLREVPNRNNHYDEEYMASGRHNIRGHRIEIDDHGVHHQSAVGYQGRNRPLLRNETPLISEQERPPRDCSYNAYERKTPENVQHERIYNYKSSPQQRTESQLKHSSSGGLGSLYKSSNNAVEFANNLERYLTSCMPSYLWIALMCLFGIWGLILIMIGTFNVPFCPSQPMIPIFLIVAGCLYLLWSVLRIYAFWPSSRNSNALGTDLTCKILEGILIVAILVWLFLGCIWVYGPKQYIHFQRNYFERHYCDGGTYWTAFVNVTLQLAIVAFGLLILACLVCTGLMKEGQ